MSHTANFLAVDLGASGGRLLVGRFDGASFVLEELHRFGNGPVRVLKHLHWDVLRLWGEITQGLALCSHQASTPLAGISVDTWGVDFALLDRAGNLLGNPYHYRDARTDGVPARVFAKVPVERCYKLTGIQVMPINTLYQLYSMVEAAHPQVKLAHTLLMMPDLFHYWLTGEQASEYTIASTSQMLDARRRRWATELLSELELPTRLLPPLVMPGTQLGTIHPEVAAATGLKSKVPIFAVGSHDTASAVAAIPALDATSAYISSGTWSLMGVEVKEPVLTDRALALNFTNEGGVGGTIRLLKNVAGLWLLQESRRQWQLEGPLSWPELLQQAAQAQPFRSLIDPDAPGLLNPSNMPEAIRSFCRGTGQPEPESVGEVARCCLESLALRYRWVLDALEELTGRRLATIYVVGGGSQNDLLNQFTADACLRPVVAGPVEATALGNIMMQAIASGHLGSLAEGRQAIGASVERRFFEPQHGEAWQEAYARFGRLLTS